MDWNRVEGNWKQIKGKVKEQWGKLTDDDIDQINGRREQHNATSVCAGDRSTSCLLPVQIAQQSLPAQKKPRFTT